MVSAATQAPHRSIPDLRPGLTVRIHEKVLEGDKERTQIFEGLIIAVHKGQNPSDATCVVRRVLSGVGVEKIVPLQSPFIEKIDVKKMARVRRAKLFFLRGRHGKSARLSERFTAAEEFALAASDHETKQEVKKEQTEGGTDEGAGDR